MSKKPGLRPGMKRKKRHCFASSKVIWITQKGPHFRSLYQVGSSFHELSQFGKMYRCRRKTDKKIFVVKAISKARFYRLDRSYNRRLALLIAMQGEIDIMRRICHKYIVSIKEIFEDNHTLYIVYDEHKGGTLLDRINVQKRYNLNVYGYIRTIEKELKQNIIPHDIYILCYHYCFGEMNITNDEYKHNVKRIIKQICEALFYMHQHSRIVHCNLRPENILFDNKSINSDIKIMDFGMSKVYPRMKQMRCLHETSYYTAPEIIKGDYCHSADMWSVGVITYLLLFGYPPFYNHSHNYYGNKEKNELYKLKMQGLTSYHEKILKQNISRDGADFITRLLETDVTKRLTAKEALQHPWLRNIMELDPCIADICMNSPSGYFEKMQRLKYIISTLFGDQWSINIKPVNLKKVLCKFTSIDDNDDIIITFAAFLDDLINCKYVTFNKQDIKRIVMRFSVEEFELDLMNMNKMEIESLVNALIHDYMVNADLRLYQSFREFDDDQDGKIKTEQLSDKIRQIDPYDNVDQMLLKIIDDYGLDYDDMIDYEEFLRALQPDLNVVPDWF